MAVNESKASAESVTFTQRPWLEIEAFPLPLGEGEREGVSTATTHKTLTPALSQRERESFQQVYGSGRRT